jgi:hypothetical protein
MKPVDQVDGLVTCRRRRYVIEQNAGLSVYSTSISQNRSA